MSGTQDGDDDLPALVDADTPPHGAPPAPPADETDEQRRARAEATKERGNLAFKAKRYADAVDLYSTAVGTPCLPRLPPIDRVLTAQI